MENNTNLSPFTIRLELLKMSQELLMNEYYSKSEHLNTQWNVLCDEARRNQRISPTKPELPPFPTENEIIAKAKNLNNFISQKT